MRSTGICCSCSALGWRDAEPLEQERSAASMARAGSSAVTAVSASVLMMIARWNRPFADGIAVSVVVLPPPPDWPKIVTLLGIAAERRRCCRGPTRARRRCRACRRCWRRANFSPPQSRQVQIAEDVQPVGHVTTTTSCLRASRAVVEDALPEPVRNPPPCSHTMTGRRPAPAPGVQTLRRRQSSLIGPLPVSGRPFRHHRPARAEARAGRTEGVAHPGPGLRLRRRQKRRRAGGRRAIGTPLKVRIPLSTSPSDLAVRGLDDCVRRRPARLRDG